MNVEAVSAKVAKQRAIGKIQRSMASTKRNLNITHRVVIRKVKWNRSFRALGNLRSYHIVWVLEKRERQKFSPKKSGGGSIHVRSHPRRGTRGVREHTRRR